MTDIDPRRLDLAREFRARPFGVHCADLQAVLNRMRGQPIQECPGGGAVFSTGAIAYAGSLAYNGYDNDLARLTTNVLRRFVDDTPFAMPR